MNIMTEAPPTTPTTTEEAVSALKAILDATPGMPDSAWQQFNVGAMRKLLVRVTAHDRANELHALINEIGAALEPGMVSVHERTGKIRAIIAAAEQIK